MADWRRTIETIIDTGSTKIYWNEPLSAHTTFHIGGYAECLVLVNHKQDLQQILKLFNQTKIPISVIGSGSNLLISKQGIKGITVKLGKAFNKITAKQFNLQPLMPNSLLSVSGATPLSKLLNYAVTHSLAGIEFLWGIPGSFGGAIYNNAGAFLQDIGSKIEQVNGFLLTGEEISLSQKELSFSYRKSKLPDGFIITDGHLKLTSGKQYEIKQKIGEYRAKRMRTQPRGASAGSIFKNPKTAAAGKLIDDCKLKGLKIGNAYISKKHGNFIINQKNAYFNDVYELMQIIKSTVELKTGTILEQEIQIFPKS